jgi:pterin-4a-carbinolamine dehydratase
LSTTKSKSRTDPTAKRPNQVCDPYGQGGKPLSQTEAEGLKTTIHGDWSLEYHHHRLVQKDTTTTTATIPQTLTREFLHPTYLAGARFLHKIAAVAQLQNHFPSSLLLERRLLRKNWQMVSRIECRTTVLGGLSMHDFHLAMVGFPRMTDACVLLIVIVAFCPCQILYLLQLVFA